LVVPLIPPQFPRTKLLIVYLKPLCSAFDLLSSRNAYKHTITTTTDTTDYPFLEDNSSNPVVG